MVSNKSKKVFGEREEPIMMEEGAAAIEQLGKCDAGLERNGLRSRAFTRVHGSQFAFTLRSRQPVCVHEQQLIAGWVGLAITKVVQDLGALSECRVGRTSEHEGGAGLRRREALWFPFHF